MSREPITDELQPRHKSKGGRGMARGHDELRAQPPVRLDRILRFMSGGMKRGNGTAISAITSREPSAMVSERITQSRRIAAHSAA
jgi:hypothetical protein